MSNVIPEKAREEIIKFIKENADEIYRFLDAIRSVTDLVIGFYDHQVVIVSLTFALASYLYPVVRSKDDAIRIINTLALWCLEEIEYFDKNRRWRWNEESKNNMCW